MVRRSHRLKIKNELLGEINETIQETENDAILVENDGESIYKCTDENDSDDDIEEFTKKFAEKLIKRINTCKNNDLSPTDKNNFISSKKSSDERLLPGIDISGIDTSSYITINKSTTESRNTLGNKHDFFSGNDALLQNSVITPDFEKKDSAPVKKSWRNMKKQRKHEKNLTAGKNWYNMKAPEVTDEIKNDFEILKMRSILNPKKFYKSNDRKSMPKYFQIGKIKDNAADFYSSRLPKKERKPTLADELLADAEFKRYKKKRMKEIIAKKQALGFKLRKRTKKRR